MASGGRCGPFVSPDIFRECVAPGYKKIRAKLEEYGVTLYGIDSDGFMMMPDHLITPGVALDDYRWFLNRWRQIQL